MRTPRPRSASARCRPSVSSCSGRMPPGCTVRTSVVQASVASSIAAWMRARPSRTRIAEPSAPAARGRGPRPAYHSTAATAEPTIRWLALTSSYTPRSSRVMTSCGEVGTSQSMSSGSGCSSASSSRQGTGSASRRGTRPRRTAREYTRSPVSHSRSAPCGCSSVPCPAIAHPTPGSGLPQRHYARTGPAPQHGSPRYGQEKPPISPAIPGPPPGRLQQAAVVGAVGPGAGRTPASPAAGIRRGWTPHPPSVRGAPPAVRSEPRTPGVRRSARAPPEMPE